MMQIPVLSLQNAPWSMFPQGGHLQEETIPECQSSVTQMIIKMTVTMLMVPQVKRAAEGCEGRRLVRHVDCSDCSEKL